MSPPEHDHACPIYELAVEDCVVCTAIAEVRGEMTEAFNRTWKENLPLICKREYLKGYADRAERQPNRYDR